MLLPIVSAANQANAVRVEVGRCLAAVYASIIICLRSLLSADHSCSCVSLHTDCHCTSSRAPQVNPWSGEGCAMTGLRATLPRICQHQQRCFVASPPLRHLTVRHFRLRTGGNRRHGMQLDLPQRADALPSQARRGTRLARAACCVVFEPLVGSTGRICRWRRPR